MSSSSGPQAVLRFFCDSVEMMPKFTSCAAAWADSAMAHAASSFLSTLKPPGEFDGRFPEHGNVIGQGKDLVGLGAVELAQQRRREVCRGAVVHHPAVAQGDGARAVLQRH